MNYVIQNSTVDGFVNINGDDYPKRSLGISYNGNSDPELKRFDLYDTFTRKKIISNALYSQVQGVTNWIGLTTLLGDLDVFRTASGGSGAVSDSGTGWATYGDSRYNDFASGLNLRSSVATVIDLDGLAGTIETQLPVGVSTLYDTSTSEILPITTGDGVAFSFGCVARTDNSNALLTVGIDIGLPELLFQQERRFRLGTNRDYPFYFTMQGYQLDTFMQNKGKLIAKASNAGVTRLWNPRLQIHRTHKAR